MISMRMRFLAGRFHATPWGHHVNEGVVEYPPSLWRFLRSLIATARRACLDEVTEEQLRRVVTALCTPPEFYLPQATVAHTRHYDQANKSVKFFDTFVSLLPQDKVIWLWQNAELAEEDRCVLAKLLESLGTFGRAESWCEVELLSAEEVQETLSQFIINSAPLNANEELSSKETIRLLMPQPSATTDKLMKALETETSTMRKNKQLDPAGTHWVTYTRPLGILTVRRSQWRAPKGTTKKTVVARFAIDSTVLPLITDALPFAEKVRRALIRNRSDTSHSEVITGKTRNGVPLAGHEHAHYFATDEDGDGRLDHLTIYAPRGFDRADLEALGSLRSIHRRDNFPIVKMVLTGLGSAEHKLDAPLFRPSKRWRSITPFSLPRFANRGGGKPPRPRDLPEAQLRRELKVRGLPEPVSIKSILGYAPAGRPLVRWLEFYSRRYNGSAGYGLAGFEIEFAEEISGPLALGFASHFGLGLFSPF